MENIKKENSNKNTNKDNKLTRQEEINKTFEKMLTALDKRDIEIIKV